MDLLKGQIQSCTKCEDLVRSRRQAVPGVGSVPAKVLFVGLAPGRNGADMTGIPFTRDPSGVLLRDILEQICLKDFYITNIVKCNPKDSKGRNRIPTNQEINKCKIFLAQELLKVSPQFIVPLGRLATEFFLGDIKQMKDAVLKRKLFGKYSVIPLFHPSYVIRGSYKKSSYIYDFLKLKEMVR